MKKHYLWALPLVCLVLLLTFGCTETFRYSIGCAEIKSNESFKFFIISDTHYMSKKSYNNGTAFQEFLKSGDGKLLQYSGELIDALVRDIERDNPDFVIFNGDLTCNGEKDSHLELAKRFKEIESMGPCVFVVPGNHDIQNPWAQKYLGDEAVDGALITSDEYVNIYGAFGYNDAVSKDLHSLSYLAMPTEDFWLLMLDTTDYDKNLDKGYPNRGGALSPQTFDWIEQCAALAKDNNARLIAVMHHSLVDHSNIFNQDYTIDNSDRLVRLFQKCGIEIVLTGHIHVQDIKTNRYDGKAIYDIATSCLAVYPHQYGRMEYMPGEGFDYRTVMLDIGKWSRQADLTDECLKNFETYSAEFFLEQCGRIHEKCLSELEGLSEEDRRIVMEIVGQMNMLYFAGYRNEALSGIVNSENFKKLAEIAPCFTKEYAMSMLNDERADNNKLFIPMNSSEVQDCRK